MDNDDKYGANSPVLTDVIFSNNQAVSKGGGMYNDGWYNGISTSDPQFVAPVAASAAPTLEGNYRLQTDSPIGKL
jgi:hypothetical protein